MVNAQTTKPRTARFVRDFHVTVGNFFARVGDDAAATKRYLAALQGERLIERRALVLFNLAKLSYAQQDLLTTFTYLREAQPDKVAAQRLRDALLLLKTRLFIGIGQLEKARDCLKLTRARAMNSAPTTLERAYLGFILRALSETWHTTARLDDMDRWASRLEPPAIANFYRMELLLLRRFAFPDSIKHKMRARGRLAHLAKLAHTSEFVKIWDLAADLFAAPSDKVAPSSLLGFHNLGYGQHNLLFNCLSLILVRELLRRRRYRLAENLAASYEQHIRRQLGAFRRAEWRRLLHENNQGLEHMAVLVNKIPPNKRANLAAIETWLES